MMRYELRHDNHPVFMGARRIDESDNFALLQSTLLSGYLLFDKNEERLVREENGCPVFDTKEEAVEYAFTLEEELEYDYD